MPRLNPLPDSELGPVTESLKGLEAIAGYVPNSFKTLAHKPDIVHGLLALVKGVFAPGSVSPELKNMVAQMASKAAGCTYCQAHMGASSSHDGVSAQKEEALWEFEYSELFSEAERAALRVAMGAGQTPNAVTDEDFDKLKGQFSDEQIVEIVAVVAIFGFFNRWNDTIATELEESPLQFAQESLAPKGWDVGKHG